LVPSATEMLFALGLGDDVVGVTHECDYPPEATARPRLTRSVLPPGLTAAEIDAAVREIVGRGEALYELDESLLRTLDVDLIVTQAVCAVCAVSYDDVRAAATRLPSTPDVLSLDPATFAEVLGDIDRLATAAGATGAGETLRRDLDERLALIDAAVRQNSRERPRVLALEWLDPPFVGGHWIPEMVERAGGNDVLGKAGQKSRRATWDELVTAEAEVVVVMPCGYDADRAAREAATYSEVLAGLGAREVYAVDAAASFSRPGPRLVDGVVVLARLVDPSVGSALSGYEGVRARSVV
jgi:iron complex transport system substrate-binding protein